jgi:DNA helicase II / ATP-dependent DNA helicase PcrA
VTHISWTDEQKDALDSPHRVTVVQAGPGSGKTKVFAEYVDRRLQAWGDRRGGIAALSFTNVARDEIESRLSTATVAPHFIGTLDAFFLKFVVAPFGHLAGLPKAGARLIPSPLDQQLTEPSIKIGAGSKGKEIRGSIFQMLAISGTEDAPEFLLRRRHVASVPLPNDVNAYALKEKRKQWATYGRVTHSDCQYLAARLLIGKYGAAICEIVTRRFPLICIDEFQDTGHFLGRAILKLLATKPVESLIVGDADQKIFGFSGVNPSLFATAESLDGAKPYPLRISHRCPARVCAVASALTRSNQAVKPAPQALNGAAFLAEHSDKLTEIGFDGLERALTLAKEDGCANAAVLVRARSTKSRIQRSVIRATPPLSANGPLRISEAIDFINEGSGRRALDISLSLACRVLFGDNHPTADELREKGVEPTQLRQGVARLLLQLAPVDSAETWGDWSARTKLLFDQLGIALGVSDYKKRLGGAFKANANKDKPSQKRVMEKAKDVAWPDGLPTLVLTIHEAKGREFDCIVYYSPKPTKVRGEATCPSVAWWAPAKDSEEREVAFVAVTRSKRMLVLSVHQESMTALRRDRAAFVKAFDAFPPGKKT